MPEMVGTHRGYDIYEWEERQGHEKYYPVFCATPSGAAPVMGGNGVSGTFGSASACRTAIDKKLEPPKVDSSPPTTEKEYKGTYRGVNMYQYPNGSYTCKYGSSTDPETVKWLIDQNLDEGAPPDTQRPTPDIAKDVEEAEATRTDEVTETEVKPHVVDTYNGIEVVYHPNTDLYYSKVGEKEKYADDMDAAHAFIDHEQYVNSKQFKIDQDKQKAEDEETMRKAFLSDEEAEAEEAKEVETQGGWLSIFWFKLKSEIRRTMEML